MRFRKGSYFKFHSLKRSKLVTRFFLSAFIIIFLFSVFLRYFCAGQVLATINLDYKINDTGLWTRKFIQVMDFFNISSPLNRQEGYPLILGVGHQQYTGASTGAWDMLKKPLLYLTNLDGSDPSSLLRSQLALLMVEDLQKPTQVNAIVHELEEDFYLETPTEIREWHFALEPIISPQLSTDPIIFIYNTHNAETYKPSYGQSKEEGKNSGIVLVAGLLQETLERKYGLQTIRSLTIHDYPDFTRSYLNSMKTAQEALEAHKTIQAVFDIHRDAGIPTKSTTTVQINGQNVASILIVIGTEHDNWRQNLAFAERLETKCNEIYPGLLRDIRLAPQRRYNQNLHPHSLILEVGSDLNTLEEAQRSVELFARVIAEVIGGGR